MTNTVNTPVKIERLNDDHGWKLSVTMSDGTNTCFGHGMTERGSKCMLTHRAKQFGLVVSGDVAENITVAEAADKRNADQASTESPVLTYREKLLSLVDAAKYENNEAEKEQLKALTILITGLWLAARPVKTEDASVYSPHVRPTEYPLYTAECVKDCPSSRYVGGVSRSLCECSQPEKCLGVRRIKLLFRGIKVTRREYMDKNVPTANGSLSGKDKHDEYWSQFVSLSVINNVASRIGIQWIAKSDDPHFNDIPLKHWEVLGIGSTAARELSMSESFTYQNAALPGVSSSDIVCINKQAANILRGVLDREYKGE